MPKLKRVVDSLEALPEAERGYYVKGQDGKFYLDYEGAAEHHQALVNERARADVAEGRLRAFGDITAEAAKETAQKLAALGDVSDVKARAAEGAVWKTKYEQAEASRVQLDRENSELALARLANESFDTHKVTGRRAVMLAVKDACKPEIVNGQRVFRVYGPDGKPLLSKRQGVSDPYMTPDEYVGDVLRNDPEYSAHFGGSGAAGSGAGGSGRGGSAGSGRTISADAASAGTDLEKIASGEVTVSS